ncbi:MAG: esterase/lipase family protein [Frankiaceae bacterium]
MRLSSLSPRRRALVIGVAALAVAGVATGVGLHAAGRSDHRAAAQDRLGPIVIVPGYGGSSAPLRSLAARLRADGRAVVLVALPDSATGPIAEQAAAVDAAVTRIERSGAPPVDVVGFSDGGLVARYWARHDGGSWRARRVVTLASPHHGTDLAAAVAGDGSAEGSGGDSGDGGGDAGGSQLCPAACRDVATGSALLTDLNAKDETPNGPLWVSIYSTDDGVVRPATSARLAGAVNIALQRVCPGIDVPHGQVPREALTVGIVRTVLGTALPRAPSATQCQALRSAGALS